MWNVRWEKIYGNGRLLLLLGSLILLALLAEPTQGQAEDRVGLVVRHGNGDVTARCVTLPKPESTGFDVLLASGIDISFEPQGVGIAVCGLEGQGCSYPADSCFCQCKSSPCFYWSYWLLESDEWRYSVRGASNRTVTPGSVEGWSWGSGTIGTSADTQPPRMTFTEICEPEQATATAAAQSTAEAAATQTAVAGAPTSPPDSPPAATATPTTNPGDPPLITYLAADRERIRAGESIVLTWETQGAGSVELEEMGTTQTVSTSGSLTLTPAVTTVYRLIARNDAGEDRIDVMITVDPALPTETPTATPVTELQSTAVPTMVPTEIATATATQTPAQRQINPTKPAVGSPTEPPESAEEGSATTPVLPAAVIDPPTPTAVLLATLTPTPTPSPTPLVLPTNTFTPAPTEAAVALVQPDSGQAESITSSNMPAREATDLAEERSEQISAAESALQALRGPFGAMLFVVAAPLALAALALLVLRVRKRERPQ